MEGGSRVEKKETDGGWCKLWMQPAISKRKKERQGETSSHAYQIAHLPHFLIMVGEQTHIQSALCVRVCVLERKRLHIIHVSLCEAVLCCQAFPDLDMTRAFTAVSHLAAPTFAHRASRPASTSHRRSARRHFN